MCLSSLSDFGIVGCKPTAAAHFSPAFCPIAGLCGGKSGKNWPRWGRFSLFDTKVRQAARFPGKGIRGFESQRTGMFNLESSVDRSLALVRPHGCWRLRLRGRSPIRWRRYAPDCTVFGLPGGVAPDETPKRRTKPPKDGGQVPAYPCGASPAALIGH